MKAKSELGRAAAWLVVGIIVLTGFFAVFGTAAYENAQLSVAEDWYNRPDWNRNTRFFSLDNLRPVIENTPRVSITFRIPTILSPADVNFNVRVGILDLTPIFDFLRPFFTFVVRIINALIGVLNFVITLVEALTNVLLFIFYFARYLVIGVVVV